MNDPGTTQAMTDPAESGDTTTSGIDGTDEVSLAPGVRRVVDDELLAQARAAGLTIKDAAAHAGMAERTARRRLAEPDLVARVDELQAERRAEDLARLEGLRPKAVTRLDELLDSESPSVQLGAIRAVLSVGPQLRDHTETESRVRALEPVSYTHLTLPTKRIV